MVSKIIKNGTELGFLHEAGRCVHNAWQPRLEAGREGKSVGFNLGLARMEQSESHIV